MTHGSDVVANTLMGAATLMFQRAREADPGRWMGDSSVEGDTVVFNGKGRWVTNVASGRTFQENSVCHDHEAANGEHIAGMDPDVAQVTAEWLAGVAYRIRRADALVGDWQPALRLALVFTRLRNYEAREGDLFANLVDDDFSASDHGDDFPAEDEVEELSADDKVFGYASGGRVMSDEEYRERFEERHGPEFSPNGDDTYSKGCTDVETPSEESSVGPRSDGELIEVLDALQDIQRRLEALEEEQALHPGGHVIGGSLEVRTSDTSEERRSPWE